MSNPSEAKCPHCAAPLPPSAPEGLCPRCLGALNLATDTGLTGADAVAAQPPLTPAELAPHFPQLEIIECLGRGGMGVVYRVRQKALNRLAALKLLAPERVTDAGFAERFTREAQALARLNHPNIVTIYDFGFARAAGLEPPSVAQPETPNSKPETETSGFYFLLMEFMDGVNLRQAMKAGRFTPEQALAIVPPVCEALQYAHEQGIVHRDIKPENLLLDKTGRLKIADFGIAKMLGADGARLWSKTQPQQAGQPTPVAAGPADTAALQHTAAGTPGYMAPEQKSAPQRVDSRADIYSLGVVIYEMLTGELPATQLQPPSRKVQIDVRLDEIVLRALEQRPELRFQSAADLRTQVQTVVSTPRGNRDESRTSSVPPRFLKAGTSTLTTPEQLATAEGQIFCYRTRGQLILDDRQLTHSRDGTDTVIPLAAIRDLSIGHYPRSMNPAGLDVLSVTYEEGGQRKQVLLSPMEGWFGLPSTFNARVAEWFMAIRAAVTAATGHAPTETPAPPRSLTVSDLVWMFLLFGLPMGLISVVFFNLSRVVAPAEPVPPADGFVPGLLGLAVVVPFLTLYLLPRWGRQPGGPQPPHAARKPPLWPTLALAAFCAPLLVHLMFLPTGQVPPEPTHAIGRLVFSFPGTLFLAGLAGVGLWLRHRRDGESSRIRYSGVLVLLLLVFGFGMLQFFAHVPSPAGVTRFDFAPVGVSNNVVIVDVTTEVRRGNAELRIVLEGPRLPAATEAALADAFFPPFAGTFVKPTPHAGNHPWRTLSAGGRQTWRLGFVLPDTALAKEAFDNLRPIGPLPAVPDRTFAGTLFEVRQTNGQEFHATLQVSKLVTSADTNWVSVFNQSANNESGLNMTWTVNASQPGTVRLTRGGNLASTQMKPDPKSKLHEVKVRLELTKLGTDRVLLVTEMGGVKSREELAGRFQDLADEVLRARNQTFKTVRGSSIELCQFRGESIIVRVDSAVPRPESTRQPMAGQYGFSGTPTFGVRAVLVSVVVLVVVIGGIVLLVWLLRKGGASNRVVLLVLAVPFVLLAIGIAAVVGLKRLAVRPGAFPLMQLICDYRHHNDPQPSARVQQSQNGFRLQLPPAQLATFELLLKQADNSFQPVPALTVLVAAGANTAFSDRLYWTIQRGHEAEATEQLWFWSVTAHNGHGRALPKLSDHGTNFTHALASHETLNWWQLNLPATFTFAAGEEKMIPLFRTHGTATANGRHPKEAWLRVRCAALPAGMKPPSGQPLIELGLAAHALLAESLPAKKPAAAGLESQLVIDSLPVSALGQEGSYPALLRWGFKCLIPAEHMAQILFVRSTNGVPTVVEGMSSYYKVGKAAIVTDFSVSYQTNDAKKYPDSASQWNVNLGLGPTASQLRPLEPVYLRLETPARTSLRSGQQMAIPLAESVSSEGNGLRSKTGVELRILLEPLKSPAVQTVPTEKDFGTHIGSSGLAMPLAEVNARLNSRSSNSTAPVRKAAEFTTPGAPVESDGRPNQLVRREVKQANPGGKDLVMTFEELRRDAKTSTASVKRVSGASVPSAMFIARGAYDIARARGAAYFVNLKEWDTEDGTRMYLIGFASDKNVDPKTYFDLKEPLPADKRLLFLSVALYERIFKDQP